MNRFEISDADKVDWTGTINNVNRFSTIPNVVSGLRVKSNTCNEEISTVDLSRFDFVKKVEVGSNSLLHVNRLMMNGLNKLTKLNIGEGSLNNTHELTIGSNSLNHVDLQSIDLKPFANLRTLSIGSNSLQSTKHILTSTMHDLQSFSVGSSSMINLIK